MKSLPFLLASIGLVLATSSAAVAYPVIDTAVPTGSAKIVVYRDSNDPTVYWYIPQSIEPWSRDNNYKSELYESSKALTFAFRGQASVEDSLLDEVAAAIGTKRANFMPIAYDTSSNLTCQNVYASSGNVVWLWPSAIGNYLEVVPVTIRTTDPDTITEISSLVHGHGLSCTVDVTFKGVSSAYRLQVTGDYDQVYSRFEADAHAGGIWWEADMHTVLENLYQSHRISIVSLEDTTIAQTDLDKKVLAASDEILKQFEIQMFTPALKLPSGEMAGKGSAWSLRADYQRSSQTNKMDFTVDSRKVTSKKSQISLRLAIGDEKR